MELSNRVIEIVNRHVGFEGQPYRILSGGWVDTPCYSWTFPSSVLDSPEFDSLDSGAKVLVELEELENFNLDPALFELYSLLDSEIALPYKSITFAVSVYRSYSRTLVVSPFSESFDIFRLESGLLFSPHDASPVYELFFNFLRTLDESYGLTIIGAGSDCIEFKLGQIPAQDDFRLLSERLALIAPDIIGEMMEFNEEIDFNLSYGQITLWWDDLFYSLSSLNAG